MQQHCGSVVVDDMVAAVRHRAGADSVSHHSHTCAVCSVSEILDWLLACTAGVRLPVNGKGVRCGRACHNTIKRLWSFCSARSSYPYVTQPVPIIPELSAQEKAEPVQC